ncbi:hypothetical protein BDR26DRAFT_940534 [Obelidium mucronatum]|nr:hypothetical protein BDR26DRAFT_940534 [Obelidium mucronatum]
MMAQFPPPSPRMTLSPSSPFASYDRTQEQSFNLKKRHASISGSPSPLRKRGHYVSLEQPTVFRNPLKRSCSDIESELEQLSITNSKKSRFERQLKDSLLPDTSSASSYSTALVPVAYLKHSPSSQSSLEYTNPENWIYHTQTSNETDSDDKETNDINNINNKKSNTNSTLFPKWPNELFAGVSSEHGQVVLYKRPIIETFDDDETNDVGYGGCVGDEGCKIEELDDDECDLMEMD